MKSLTFDQSPVNVSGGSPCSFSLCCGCWGSWGSPHPPGGPPPPPPPPGKAHSKGGSAQSGPAALCIAVTSSGSMCPVLGLIFPSGRGSLIWSDSALTMISSSTMVVMLFCGSNSLESFKLCSMHVVGVGEGLGCCLGLSSVPGCCSSLSELLLVIWFTSPSIRSPSAMSSCRYGLAAWNASQLLSLCFQHTSTQQRWSKLNSTVISPLFVTILEFTQYPTAPWWSLHTTALRSLAGTLSDPQKLNW